MSDLEEVGVLHVGGRLDNVCDTLLDLAFLAVVRALVGVLGVTRLGLAGNVELSVTGSHVGVRDRRLGHDADAVHAVGGALVFASGAAVGLLAGDVKHSVGGSHVGVWKQQRQRHQCEAHVSRMREQQAAATSGEARHGARRWGSRFVHRVSRITF